MEYQICSALFKPKKECYWLVITQASIRKNRLWANLPFLFVLTRTNPMSFTNPEAMGRRFLGEWCMTLTSFCLAMLSWRLSPNKNTFSVILELPTLFSILEAKRPRISSESVLKLTNLSSNQWKFIKYSLKSQINRKYCLDY